MRRLLVGAVLAASLGGVGSGAALAACDPDYRPLCLSECHAGTPNIKDPTDTSWLIRYCPDSVTADKAEDECENAARCLGYCGNQRFYPEAAVSWTNKFLDCMT